MKALGLATIWLQAYVALTSAIEGTTAATAEKASRQIKVEPSIGHFGYLPFNKWLFGDGAYAHYTTCDGHQLSQYNVKRTCELMLVSIDNKARTTNRTCRVDFHVNERAPDKFLPKVHGHRVILPHVYFTRRNERNFPTEMYMKYRVVDMNSCESHDIKLLINPEFVVRNNLLYFHNNLDFYENNIAVFVPNDGLCYGALCKLTYDSRGQKIGATAGSYLPQDMTGNFVQLFPTSTPSVYFALVLEWKKRRPDGKRPYSDAMQIMHATEGKSAELMKFNYRAGFTELFADVSNGHFGVCRRYTADERKLGGSRRSVHCAQFDEQTRAKTMDMAFELGNSTRPIAVYNTPGGGLLLISGKCGHRGDENLCQNLIFEQIKPNGKGKVRHIHECEYNVPLAAFARDGDSGQLCVSLYHSCSDNGRFEVNLAKKCYAKKLFF